MAFYTPIIIFLFHSNKLRVRVIVAAASQHNYCFCTALLTHVGPKSLPISLFSFIKYIRHRIIIRWPVINLSYYTKSSSDADGRVLINLSCILSIIDINAIANQFSIVEVDSKVHGGEIQLMHYVERIETMQCNWHSFGNVSHHIHRDSIALYCLLDAAKPPDAMDTVARLLAVTI